jgi:hypothetical protein
VRHGCLEGADAELSTLQQRVDRLEALIGRVEGISAIKRLQHAYGHYSELGLWHDFAETFPSDRPLRGSIAAPFPKVYTVPFHYKNPVSGRVPPVLLP